MFKQLRKANQNDYLLITATLILLVVFNLSLLSYVQGQQKAAELDQAKDYEEALKFADAALYEVKIAGKNNFASYKSSLTEKKHHNQLGLGLRALAAGDPTPLLVMQMDTKEAIYVNKSLLEMFGCELSSEFYDYYGQSLLNLISPGDQARVKEEFTDFVESAVDEERFRGDCQILTAAARTLRVFCDMKYSVNQRYGALVYISFVLN
ncbi:PAS domain-containing protein [Lactobacillus delbrueckii]|uniref:PAS domain-containing protein n=1 Tax=Lactobacillus delbrueckii TaxID=1584 RepID=UPI001E5CF5A8|nr:PAS domain-containing protein [Lactobacillus delbrueckii]MCD5440754.1 hypothetical protein [Lactobacillus delbrueckii subsp. lactis]MCD5484942.1 hypothetical protein [Lactobacillus delbrueckii subsp. lactis]